MKEIITSLLITIILIGIAVYLFNNDNGIGPGLIKGGENVKNKIIDATNFVAPIQQTFRV